MRAGPGVVTNSCNRRVCRGQIRLNRSISDAEGRATEANRSFDATLSYAKFYVKYHLSSLRSTKKEQGTVSSSLHQPLGPVSISRRSAAGSCTDVQDRCAKAASASRPTCVCIVHARLSSCGAVVRAGSTTGMLLARGIHQPKHHQQQEAAGDGRPTDRVRAEPTVGLGRALRNSTIPTELGSQLFV